MTKEIVILSGARTAVGTYGGSLKDIPPTQLAATCVREAVARASIEPQLVEQLVLGNVIHSEARDMYIARVAALEGGLAEHTTALTLNRLCGSGLQAVISAAQALMLGDAKVAVAGGAESMSRAGYLAPALRWGQRMGDAAMIDMMSGVLTDPFGNGHMGMTAENVAREFNISREQQDILALESHLRAERAIRQGYFKQQIVPVELHSRRGPQVFDTDEHVRNDAHLEDFSKLRPVFQKDGRVTAGNASGLNDGAAALVLMQADMAEKQGLQPMARIVAYGHAGVSPAMMGIGPVQAVKNALQRAGLNLPDMDVIESNEAFAAQACAVAQALELDPEKTNPNGGAIALGHPIGASGAIITVKALYELQRTGGRYGLITMCVGGGQGIALIIEAIH
ncbi:MAG: acetyl-CoA C-acyltransferase family protein [Amphritea sp.]